MMLFSLSALFSAALAQDASSPPAVDTTTALSLDALALKQKVIEAAGGETNLMRLFRMKDLLKVGSNPDKPAKQRDAVLEPPEHWWIGKRDRVVANQEPATYLVWAWTLGILTDQASKIQLLPAIREGEHNLVGLRISESVSPPMDIYFRKSSHQLVRIDWRADIHRFSEWQDFGGVTYPSKCDGFKKNAKSPWYRCKILELETLAELPAGLKRKTSRDE
jgi:hypothetical protein